MTIPGVCAVWVIPIANSCSSGWYLSFKNLAQNGNLGTTSPQGMIQPAVFLFFSTPNSRVINPEEIPCRGHEVKREKLVGEGQVKASAVKRAPDTHVHNRPSFFSRQLKQDFARDAGSQAAVRAGMKLCA